jgi:hypothetical protein
LQLVIPPGADLHVHFSVRLERPAPGWHFRIAIDSFLGWMVLATDSDENLGLDLSSLSGLVEFDVVLPVLSIGEGTYNVHVACIRSDGTTMDNAGWAAQFGVQVDDYPVIGSLYTHPRVLIEPNGVPGIPLDQDI